MEELWEETKMEFEAVDPEAGGEYASLLFLCGKETWEGYYPNLSVGTDLRFPGYWTLDEIVEANNRWDRENTPGYKVISTKRISKY